MDTIGTNVPKKRKRKKRIPKSVKDLHNQEVREKIAIASQGTPEGTPNATEQKAPKFSAGKRRTMEERRRLRAEIAAWRFSDPDYREPPTVLGLAKGLGVSGRYVTEIISRLPKTLEEYLELCQTHTLARAMSILDNLADKAESNDKDAVTAMKTFLNDMALPKMRNAKVKPKDGWTEENKKLFESLPTSVKRRAIETPEPKTNGLDPNTVDASVLAPRYSVPVAKKDQKYVLVPAPEGNA